jgi:hypothetical protein
LCTLKTTGFEHAYRRLRMRIVIKCEAGQLGKTG